MTTLQVLVPLRQMFWTDNSFEARLITGSSSPAIVSLADQNGILVSTLSATAEQFSDLPIRPKGIRLRGTGRVFFPGGFLIINIIQTGAATSVVVAQHPASAPFGSAFIAGLPAQATSLALGMPAMTWGWHPPKVHFDPPDLTSAGEYVSDRINAGINTARRVIDNAIDDIGLVFGALSECLAKIDHVRIVLTHRAMEYADEVLRETLGPVFDWLAQVVFGETDPTPRLWRVRNPIAAFHNNVVADLEEIDVATTDVFRNPILYVHGLFLTLDSIVYTPTPDDAFNYWVPFEAEHQLFSTADNNDAIVLSWNSGITQQEFERALVMLNIAGVDKFGIVLATAWHELQRRAKKVTDWLRQFASHLSQTSTSASPFMTVTHSMGAYVWSGLIGGTEMQHNRWWNFAGAVPFESYGPGGEFDSVSTFFPPNNQWGNELSIWYSYGDWVLAIPYHLANQTFALGSVGENTANSPPFWQQDTSLQTGINHGPGGYFSAIGSSIRSRKSPPF